jgi:hypothetical protein
VKTKVCVFVVGLLATIGVTMGAATAAPQPIPELTITLDCPGTEFDGPVAVQGGGVWSPAFPGGDVVLLPVAFGPETGVGTGPDGTFPLDRPAFTQNENKGGNHPRVDCTYHVEGEFGPFSFVIDGTVTAAIVGRP